MNRKRVFFLCACFIVALITTLVSIRADRQGRVNLDQKEVGFPFEVKDEKKLDSVGGPKWEVTVILSKELYSKEKLDRLFQFYSKKYPDHNERLQVQVYTDINNLEIELNKPFCVIRSDDSESRSPAERKTRTIYNDAIFHRQGSGALAGGGYNEWYVYVPDLNAPTERKTIVLRGRDPFAKKSILEIKEITNQGLNLRAVIYELTNVEPQGIYYTVEATAKGSQQWGEVLTFRVDKQVSIPTNPVRFVNDKVAYLFLGWLYAVTLDGGNTWSVWDAQRDLPDRQCCNSVFVEDVQISPDGTGTMFISSIDGKQSGTSKLVTQDYGRHWINQ